MTRVISIFIALILLSSFSLGIRTGDLNIAGNIFSDAGTVTWNVLTDFPVGCNVGEAVRVIGSTLTCVSLSGISDLNSLTDVNITNPQNGNIISFNSSTSIWENTVLDVNTNIREFVEANDFNLNGVWDWNGFGTNKNVISVLFSPSTIDLSAIRIVADMNSQGNTNVVQVEYNVLGLSGGDNTNAYLTQLQGNPGDFGTASAYTALKTGDGNVTYVALNVGEGVAPIFQSKGDSDDMNVALLFDADLNLFSNVTAAFASDTNNVELFSENDDVVYVGNGNQFSFIRFDLNVVASAQSVLPVFEFSDGVGGFNLFIPSSTLDGFRQSGQAVWNISDLTGWSTDDVNGNSDLFWIRITRNAQSVTVTPIENTVTIAGATDFFWGDDGNLFVSTVSMDSFGVPTNDTICRSGSQIVDCLGSSTRYKWNVVDLNIGLTEIIALRPVTFDYNLNYAPNEPRHIGFIAEEVEVVSTLLVDYIDGNVEGVNYLEIIPVLTMAIKDLAIQVSTVDTNSQTACSGTDVLRGDGTCGSTSTFNGLVPAYNITSDGNATFGSGNYVFPGTLDTGNQKLTGAAPKEVFVETGVTADNTTWRIIANAEAWLFQANSDDESSSTNFMTVQRSEQLIDSITLAATTVAITGNETISGDLTVNGGDGTFTRSTSGAGNTLKLENSSDTADSHALITIVTGGNNGGDARLQFVGSGAGTWYTGFDNTDNDYKIDWQNSDFSDPEFHIDNVGNTIIKGTLATGVTSITGTSSSLIGGDTTIFTIQDTSADGVAQLSLTNDVQEWKVFTNANDNFVVQDGNTGDVLLNFAKATKGGGFKTTAGSFIFNENADDMDFRIEGTTQANLFRANAGTNRIGIGDSAPNQLLGLLGTNAQISIEESNIEFVRIGVEETGGDMMIGWDDADDMHFGVFSSPADTSIVSHMIIEADGDIIIDGELTSTKTDDLGWSVVSGANTACNTTCTSACVMGFADQVAGADPVSCTNATADSCLCAGAS